MMMYDSDVFGIFDFIPGTEKKKMGKNEDRPFITGRFSKLTLTDALV